MNFVSWADTAFLVFGFLALIVAVILGCDACRAEGRAEERRRV